MMEITNFKEVQANNNPHGVDARKIHENEDAQVIHILLKPGEKLKPHKTPVDVFFYVLEGNGMVQVGDEKMEVVKDDLIDSHKNILHCLFNESEKDFRVLVVKTPTPNSLKNR
ncbi:cupin domain-containing protein [Labilibaculum sp.]|uniref:cupin domain-containing protein n=1 Tax=Labilibaculum sp. TaxID=2060723 RepID=UPI00356646B7